MFETEGQIEELQALLDRSFAGSGSHIGSIVTAERRLSARQVVDYLQNVKHVAFATVSAKGEPFVSPLDGWFLHGGFVVSTSATAVKVRHVRRNPAVSLVHMVGDDVGIWVHGRATILEKGHPTAVEYDRVATTFYGLSPYTMADAIVVIVVEPRAMFAYAPQPEGLLAARR